MDDARSFRGRCHCGALEVDFRTRIAPEAMPVRACQCSFCRRHQTRTVADPAGSAAFAERELGAAVRYRFGLWTADYLICGRCGVYLGAAVIEPGSAVAIVNAPVLDDHRAFGRRAEPVTYDHEDVATRVARRRATWTPLLSPLPGVNPGR